MMLHCNSLVCPIFGLFAILLLMSLMLFIRNCCKKLPTLWCSGKRHTRFVNVNSLPMILGILMKIECHNGDPQASCEFVLNDFNGVLCYEKIESFGIFCECTSICVGKLFTILNPFKYITFFNHFL